jgi:methanol---5-hydroxybenzimidazolylcobamide Co-methyltransferase
VNRTRFNSLAISSPDALVFGRCPRPVTTSSGLVIGGGQVYPELNFTLPPMLLDENTWADARRHYQQIGEAIVRRAAALHVPGLVVEFEQLPPMTQNPQWGAELTAVLAASLKRLRETSGIPSALRVTIVDLRDAEHPPRLREGPAWERMREALITASQAGADILSIESVAGKEVHDQALLYGDLTAMAVALGVLAARDMAWLWDNISAIAEKHGIISGGDSACGFANTAMQLAGQGMLPSVLAAVDRAATGPRSLVAFEHGAVGPSKDCAYEGPVLKAIAGCPISMEGKSSSCAHFSPLGNIAAAAADLWSNESVQNVRLLSGSAPEAFLELLIYDCRLFNSASESGDALRLRDCMVASDVPHSVEALMLDPAVVIDLARAIVEEKTDYTRTVRAIRVGLDAIHRAINAGRVRLREGDDPWLRQLSSTAEALPETEGQALAAIADEFGSLYNPASYGL